MNFFKKLRKIPHQQARSIAVMCAGMALLLLAAVFISQGGMQRAGGLALFNNGGSNAAATWLGNQWGLPPGYTGKTYPDYALCWYNASGYGYGPQWTPVCTNHPGSNQNIGDPSPFYTAVFSVYPGGSGGSTSGYTQYINSSYNWDTVGTYQQDIYVGPPEISYDADWNPISDCNQYSVPAGDDWLSIGSDGNCYGFKPMPPTVTSSIGGNGVTPSVAAGGQLTLEWSCLPSRQVNWESKSGQGSFSQGGWGGGVLYLLNPVTSSVTLSGPGWSYSENYTGSATVAAPSTGGTYTYSLSCNGPYSLPTMYITVAVTGSVCPNNGGVGSWAAGSNVITGGGSGPISTPWGRICATNYTGNIYFIPVNTQAEWNSFIAATGRLSVGYFGY